MRCEGWRRRGGAFTMGIPEWSQCDEDATVSVMVKGAMPTPACNICWQECIDNKKIEVLSVAPFREEDYENKVNEG